MARVPWAASVLLVLLVLHPPMVSPLPARHLCGSHLVDTLYFVCGDKGFYYRPNRSHKRDLDQVLGLLSRRARQERRLLRDFGPREEAKVKRGIVELCCHKPCSLQHLEGYCD
ncbi:preproinsulin b [Synchiropus splendidus]|uniref:preproinsulin b n=1 Tax=Synchiropus splendidus TaxID=270530 RepID=UPI00237E6774|nr:preproinsulin b [Synchiropus splendidus]XP_053735153.1 preproinsulin b [Synchiropus splendidus]